ncbi:MAG: hypothetical protein F6K50_50040 [Moorea sp. SIO3I7]|nr:hypothetical protein [Moorena sp. SIO3I7]
MARALENHSKSSIAVFNLVGSREQGTGSREQGAGNRGQGTAIISLPHSYEKSCNHQSLITNYSVFHTYQVDSNLLPLLPTPYSLLPTPYSLLPTPYSLTVITMKFK